MKSVRTVPLAQANPSRSEISNAKLAGDVAAGVATGLGGFNLLVKVFPCNLLRTEAATAAASSFGAELLRTSPIELSVTLGALVLGTAYIIWRAKTDPNLQFKVRKSSE